MSHYIQNNTISTTVLTPRNRDTGDKKIACQFCGNFFFTKKPRQFLVLVTSDIWATETR